MERKLKIRFANISDLPSIVDIYNQAIRSRCSTGDVEEFAVDQRIGWFENKSNLRPSITVPSSKQGTIMVRKPALNFVN